MAQTFTSTAYSATPKSVHQGLFTQAFDYSIAATSLSASANSAVLLGPKIMDQTTIVGIMGYHSTGSASCPVDIGYDDTISAFASQKTQASYALTSNTTLPFKVTITDTSVTRYITTKFGITPGTDTASGRLAYTFLLSRDPN